jgi:hypothetical protein
MRLGSRALKTGAVVAALCVAAVALPRSSSAEPSFGVSPGGPSPFLPGDILNPAPGSPAIGPLPPPSVVIPGTSLGLPAGSVIDDISYGDDVYPPAGPFFAQLSVGQGSTGHPAAPMVSPNPNVTNEMSLGDGAVAGDIYSSFNTSLTGGPTGAFSPVSPPAPCGPIGSNIQTADENGIGAGPFASNVGLGLVPGDNVNKLDNQDHTFVDFLPVGAPDGKPDSPVFFTVDPATAAALPPLPPFFGGFGPQTGADVLAWDPTTSTLYDWAPQAMLGMAGVPNDIDALSVYYPGGSPPISAGWTGAPDVVVFSFAPGSPMNAGLGSICFGPGSGTPGDVYFDTTPFGPPPSPAIDAEMMGLDTVRSGGPANDNLDAIDLVPATGGDSDGDGIDDAVDFDRDDDGVGNGSDNCPDVANPSQANNDGTATFPWIKDGVGPEGATMGGDACDTNNDNNGCDNVTEMSPNHVVGGQRDPLDPWDFADMWVPSLPAAGSRNGAITIADAIAALPWIGTSTGGPPNVSGRQYSTDTNANGVPDGAEYDRSPSMIAGMPWRSGPPNGAVSIADALVVVNSIGDHC